MKKPVAHTTKSRAKLVKEIYERELSPEEFERRCVRALEENETIDEARELIRWFRSRYPDALDRLRYARRQYAVWMRRQDER
jgi:hypothetical protein